MNKDVKKTVAILEDREAKNAEVLGKARAELDATSAKLKALREEIDNAQDANQYTELLHEIRDTEAVLQFCEKRVKQAESNTLTAEEYKNIVSEAQDSFKAVKADAKKSVKAEVDKLVKILTDYDNQVAELNDLLQRAGVLNRTAPVILNPQTITSISSDPNDPYHLFVASFYKLKALREVASHT